MCSKIKNRKFGGVIKSMDIQGITLYLQQNSGTLPFVFGGVFCFIYLLYSIIMVCIVRHSGSDVCVLGFVPVVNLIVPFVVAIMNIARRGKVAKQKPVGKVKQVTTDDVLGEDEEITF